MTWTAGPPTFSREKIRRMRTFSRAAFKCPSPDGLATRKS